MDKDTLETTLTVLLKHESDLQKARRALMGTRPHPIERDSRQGGQGGSGGQSGRGYRRFGDWNN